MKILYFELYSVLYPEDYVSREEVLRKLYQAYESPPILVTLIETLIPDFAMIEKLKSIARAKGCLLQPVGDLGSRDVLITYKIFDECILAPNIDMTGRMRPDDRDPIRWMFAHSGALGAEWYVYGDMALDERLVPFSKGVIR